MPIVFTCRFALCRGHALPARAVVGSRPNTRPNTRPAGGKKQRIAQRGTPFSLDKAVRICRFVDAAQKGGRRCRKFLDAVLRFAARVARRCDEPRFCAGKRRSGQANTGISAARRCGAAPRLPNRSYFARPGEPICALCRTRPKIAKRDGYFWGGSRVQKQRGHYAARGRRRAAVSHTAHAAHQRGRLREPYGRCFRRARSPFRTLRATGRQRGQSQTGRRKTLRNAATCSRSQTPCRQQAVLERQQLGLLSGNHAGCAAAFGKTLSRIFYSAVYSAVFCLGAKAGIFRFCRE